MDRERDGFMEQVETWPDLVPRCFGYADARFAKHPSDARHAREAIEVAKGEGASVDDFRSAVEDYVRKNVKVGVEGHLRKDFAKLYALWRE
jgi:hypothetical protein